MPDPVIPSEVLEGVLKNYVLAGSDSVTVGLFTNNFTPDKNTVLADFIEAAYSGYSPCDVDFAPALADGNEWHMTPGHATFAAPSTGSPVDLYGIFVEWTPPFGEDPLLFSMRFDTAPLSLAPGDLPLAVFVDLRDLDVLNP
jgi:hypothetical protein